MKKIIAQISDIHFGEKNFEEKLKANLLNQLKEKNPDLIVFSGDLTTHGFPHEYEQAAEFVEDLRAICQTYVIPGNHDARNVGLLHFEKMIGHRRFVHQDKEGEFAVIGLDSSEPDINDGQIGTDQLEWLKTQLEKVPNDYSKIVTFHHHLLPIPQTGRERNILLDSGDLLKILTDNGVDLVLNGHKHVPNVWMVEKMVTVNSGTATTRKLRGLTTPSYNQISFNYEELLIDLIDTETGKSKLMANYTVKVENEEYVVCAQKHKGDATATSL